MNTNCLKGKKCPRCGSDGPFQVSVSVWILLYDSGADDAEDSSIEYDDASPTICSTCRHRGEFRDFTAKHGVNL